MIQLALDLIILEKQVECLRNQLYRNIDGKHTSLSSLEVIETSQELDKLLNQFMIIKNKLKENKVF